MSTDPLHILAIPGSLRRASHNRALLEAARQVSPPDLEIAMFDGLGEVPLFNEDLERPTPPGVEALRRAVAESDGLLIATPEYNQSVPGVVKNMVDWLSRSRGRDGLTGMPVAVIGATTGPWGTRLAQTQLRQILTSTQALVMAQPTLFIRDAGAVLAAKPEAEFAETSQQLEELLTAFGHWIRRLRHPTTNSPQKTST